MPTFETHTDANQHYQSGFANDFATEALPGALPIGRNSPQRAAYGLYAEQFSGTAFTAPRAHNRRSWLYRIRPGAVHKPFTRVPADALRAKLVANFADVPPTPPNQLALGSAADARRADRFHRRLGDDGRQRRRRIDERLRDSSLRREPVDAGPLLLQQRRRTADRAAARPPRDFDGARQAGRRTV